MYDLNSDVALQLHFPFCNIFSTLFFKNPTNLRYHFCTAIAEDKGKEILCSAEEIKCSPHRWHPGTAWIFNHYSLSPIIQLAFCPSSFTHIQTSQLVHKYFLRHCQILFKVEANDIIPLNSSSDLEILSKFWGKGLTNSQILLWSGVSTPPSLFHYSSDTSTISSNVK